MRSLTVLLFFLISIFGCVEPQVPNLPNLPSLGGPKTIEEAKQVAHSLDGQTCKFTGFRSLGMDDVGVYLVECPHSVHSFTISSAHMYDRDWHDSGYVRFIYNEEPLLREGFILADPRRPRHFT